MYAYTYDCIYLVYQIPRPRWEVGLEACFKVSSFFLVVKPSKIIFLI